MNLILCNFYLILKFQNEIESVPVLSDKYSGHGSKELKKILKLTIFHTVFQIKILKKKSMNFGKKLEIYERENFCYLFVELSKCHAIKMKLISYNSL